ncbi:MAG: ABC transporter ATP-binding protein [archaeon]|nr:ABC transporter ATP-binding protein [archaeon]
MQYRRTVVKLEDVWVHFDGVTALEEINLSINQRDFLGIIGPNGGGKTTLLKVILGLLKPSRGEVRVFGDTPERGRKFVGYVPQYSLFDRDFPVSVWDVVLMGRLGRMKGFKRYSEEDEKLAYEALRTVEMLDFSASQIGKLSGGQQQRVFIARALVTEPRLLLLDEPMASVDSPMQTELYGLFEKLRHRMAIVLVSHDISAVSIYVDKIACLNRRLFYHNTKEITAEDLEATYQCPVEIIAHGVPHRVLKVHK